MSLLRFRLAGPADGPVIHAINAAAYLPAYAEIVDTAPEPVTRRYDDDIARGDVCIAEVDGRMAGVIVMEARLDHILVYSVAVIPTAQNRGLGKALLLFAEHQAVRGGLSELRLSTNLKMDKNIAIYRSYGLVERVRRPHPFRPGEVEVDMAKPVDLKLPALPVRLA